ncbi:hypothetical protein C5167_049486 [Papaver somniferum]|uniref:Uncharacterized protein n=1 Tax=Papaver somniferum TaxID=3469 RepID=A0A4Y7KC84_PAPSO|nr:hypothetical protein C5167_032701 [Papaver somniferum]RZC74006.1 hypothetical protein C5167_049486 [Papaver somniferum]
MRYKWSYLNYMGSIYSN